MKESKFKKAIEKFDPEISLNTDEALKLITSQPRRKFLESVDVAVRLGIDPKKSDQNVRGSVTLPNSLGKEVKVAVFVGADKACLLYTSPSPRDRTRSRMPSSA